MAQNFVELFRGRCWFGVEVLQRTSAALPGLAVLITGKSARRPSPNRAKTEARVTHCFCGPSHCYSPDRVLPRVSPGIENLCLPVSCAHFLAMHRCLSTLSQLQRFIAGPRWTIHGNVAWHPVRTLSSRTPQLLSQASICGQQICPIQTRRRSSQSRPGVQIPNEQAITEVGPMHQNPDTITMSKCGWSRNCQALLGNVADIRTSDV